MKETVYGFKTRLRFFIERIENLRSVLGVESENVKILDVGCGNGAQVTLPLGAEGYRVIGIDIHEPTIEKAKQNNDLKNVEFICGYFEKVRGKSFDVIVLSDILEHLAHPKEFLGEIYNLLSPNGIILISVPNGYGPFEIENFILRRTGILKLGRWLKQKLVSQKGTQEESALQTLNHDNGHVQFFTRDKFGKLLKDAGFYVRNFKKGCVLGGSLTARAVSAFEPLIKLNVAAGKYLPHQMCSVWYFEARKMPQAVDAKGGDLQNYPRLLMITSSVFNPLSGGGITFTNLFHGWPKGKIAAVHNDKITPSTDICDKYYYLGAKEFKWAFPFSFANLFGAQEKIEDSLRAAKGVAASRKTGGGILSRVLRLAMPAIQVLFGDEIPTKVCVSNELEKFIEEFKPEVIYTILGSLPYIRLVNEVADKFNLPVVIHMMDDWPEVRYKKGILGFYKNMQMQKELQASMKRAAACLSICDSMSKSYEKRYGRHFESFHNALDAQVWLKKAKKDWERRSPFKLVYSGALMPDSQLGSVRDVCDAVDSLHTEGLDIEFDIYAPWYAAQRYRAELERPDAVKV
ncbi:MAG: methyltransferase domain-containing protein, partial [Patescibacteria group bacterium]